MPKPKQVVVQMTAQSYVEIKHRYDEPTQERMSTWEVTLDGMTVGQVERRMCTRETRSRGNRYVNSRWQSPGWVYRTTDSYYSHEVPYGGRKECVSRILTSAEVSYADRERLLDTMLIKTLPKEKPSA